MSKSSATAERPEKKKKPVLTFRLRKGVGSHFEKNLDYDPSEEEDEDNRRDVEFKAGDTIKSRRRLDKIFPNKFILVEGHAGLVNDTGGDDVDEENDPDAGRPVRSKEMATRRQPGRYLEEHELEGHELQKLTKGRHVKAAAAGDKYGDDCTDDFDGAKDADFIVFRKGDRYTIADADDPSKPLRKGLRRGKVAKALKALQQD